MRVHWCRCAVFALGVLACGVLPAAAQTAPPAGRFELGFGTVWRGDTSLGGSDANETTAAGSTLRLFSTTSSLGAAAGIEGRIAVHAWRRLDLELFSSVAKPVLETQVSNDSESGTGLTATETVEQYTVGGGALWYLRGGTSRQRLWPFVSGSVAYLRQLHASNTLAVTGRMVEVGVGAKYFLRTRPRGMRGVGIRGDARLSAATKGVGFDDRTRYAPSLAASLFVRF